MTCPDGRNAGLPTPGWWPKVRALLEKNRSYFPREIPLSFLGAWVEQESDGRHALVSKLDEVGYFQVHPAEAADYFNTTIDRIKADSTTPTGSIQWGGRLLKAYDRQLENIGVPKTGSLYLGLLKAMHWGPWARIWAQHVQHALGRWPESYDEFYHAAERLKLGQLSWKPGLKLPKNLPSCSAQQTMARAVMFPSDEDRVRDGSFLTRALYQTAPEFMSVMFPGSPNTAFLAMLPSGLGGAGLGVADFPGVRFRKPVDGKATGVWGDARNGLRFHEGVDVPAPSGTPVYAVASGRVWHAGRSSDPAAGIWVGVEHQGAASGWASRYMHLSAINVVAGQQVDRGDVIGLVGDTGANSPHLHFSLLLDAALLPSYSAAFGEPKTGFGRDHGKGIAVPAEPVIPFDGYELTARNRLANLGVGVYVKPVSKTAMVWGLVGVGIAAVAVIAGVKSWKGRGR